jgi:multiple sugar transport system substrate-binding protein
MSHVCEPVRRQMRWDAFPAPQRGWATRRAMGSAAGAALAVPVLASCAGTAPAPPAKTLSGTVEFWTNPGYAYKDRIGQKLVEEFQQANPGVTIAWSDAATAGTNHAAKLVTNAAAGTMPDLSYLDRFNTKSFACRGIIRSLDDYMRTAKHARIANYFPREQNDTTYQGKPWAVPHGPVVGLLYLNRSLFKDAGLDPDKPPTTWDATLTAVQRLTKRAGGATTQVGWAPQRGFGVPWMVPYWQLGGELTSPDEKQAAFNNDKAIQVFEWFLKVYDTQGGDDAVGEAFGPLGPFDAFAQGRCAMVWAAHSQHAISFSKVPNLDVGFSHWPTPPSNARSNYMGGWSLVIPKLAKNPDAGFAYLDHLSNDDAQIRWADEWNTVPSTKAPASSDKYIQNKPDRKVAVADMPTAKWVITAIGGDKALAPSSGFANMIVQKKVGIRDALAQAVTDTQAELEAAQRLCGP